MSDTDMRLDMLVQGVNIITTAREGKQAGMTCAWASQVSKELVMVCMGWQSATRQMIEETGVFAINVLRRDQLPLAKHFGTGSSAAINKFQGINTASGATGAPLLADAPISIECRVQNTYDPDPNELIIIGKVVGVTRRQERFEPLIFKQEDY